MSLLANATETVFPSCRVIDSRFDDADPWIHRAIWDSDSIECALSTSDRIFECHCLSEWLRALKWEMLWPVVLTPLVCATMACSQICRSSFAS